jgi:hypothetical protein
MPRNSIYKKWITFILSVLSILNEVNVEEPWACVSRIYFVSQSFGRFDLNTYFPEWSHSRDELTRSVVVLVLKNQVYLLC